MVEQWLRRTANATAEQEITVAAAAYYPSLRVEERTEDEALARALSDATRHVS